jgi:16S rRNA (guanine527-N7)-methyltransferase
VKHGINKKTARKEILLKAREICADNEKEIEHYIDLLLEWNKKINLVSRNVSRETIQEHITHSLLPVPLGLLANHQNWIDAGTGGGLPGIPLAIAEPEMEWILNDNVRKKIKVVDDIIQKMGMKNSYTLPKSISLVELQKGTGIITKHAFKISGLLRLLGDKPWKTIIMWKGAKDAEEEIIQSRKKLNATIYEFDFGKEETFYEGKGIVLIER